MTESYVLPYTVHKKSHTKHQHTVIIRQRWELIDVFHCVLAMWHHKAKLKVKALKQTISEVMPLDHTELVNRLLTNSKLHTAQAANHSDVHRTSTYDSDRINDTKF